MLLLPESNRLTNTSFEAKFPPGHTQKFEAVQQICNG